MVQVLPLGTGNDLSLSFGWGNTFLPQWLEDFASVYDLLRRIAEAQPRELDCWRATISAGGRPLPNPPPPPPALCTFPPPNSHAHIYHKAAAGPTRAGAGGTHTTLPSSAGRVHPETHVVKAVLAWPCVEGRRL